MDGSIVSVESRGRGTVGELKGATHQFYEDRFRLLSKEIEIVREAERGEIFAVFDGVSSAPMGMRSAQAMADALIAFFTEPDSHQPTTDGLRRLILEANQEIFEWGMENSLPRGGCAGTIAWLSGEEVTLFHAGDTEAWLFRDGTCLNMVGREAGGSIYLTEYFGKGEQLQLTTRGFKVLPGERLLLFTDGLRKVVDQVGIDSLLCSPHSPEDCLRDLLVECEMAYAPDDVTALIIVGD